LVGCTYKKVENCPIASLIINEDLFPQGTHAEVLYSPVPDDPINSAERSFYYATDLAYQEVIRWNSVRDAKDYFNFREKSVFDVDKYMGPWTTPPELDYTSAIADKYRVACGIDSGIYQCRLIATYDGYFVFFRSYVTEEGLSLSIFNQLLRAIDLRMTQCLGK
jgi:hypothetical protein